MLDRAEVAFRRTECGRGRFSGVRITISNPIPGRRTISDFAVINFKVATELSPGVSRWRGRGGNKPQNNPTSRNSGQSRGDPRDSGKGETLIDGA